MNDRVELARMAVCQLNRTERRAFLATFTEATPTVPTAATPDRICRRHEAAHLLGRSPRAVDRLAAAGVLRKVMLPGARRAAGFRLRDLQTLIAGGTP